MSRSPIRGHGLIPLLALAAGAPCALGQHTANWINDSGNWSTTANWDLPGGVPGGFTFPDNGSPTGADNYIVNINNTGGAAAYTVTLDVANITLNEMFVDDDRPTLDLNSNQIDLLADFRQDRAIIQNGVLTAGGPSVLRGVTMINISQLALNGNMTIGRSLLSANDNDFCDVCIDYGGSAATWEDTVDIILGGTSAFNLSASSTLTMTNDQTMRGDGAGTAGTVNNSGTIRKDTGGGSTLFQDIDLNNLAGSRIEVATGTLQATGNDSDVDNQGALRIDSGATFDVTGGASLANYNGGTLTLSGGVFDVAGTLQFNGADIQRLSTDLVLDGAAAVIQDESSNNALGGVLAISDTFSMTLRNSHDFVAGGDVSVEQDGRLTLEAGTSFTIPNGSELTNLLPNGTLVDGVFEVHDGATLEVFDGAIDRIQGDVTLDGANAMFVDQNGLNIFSALDNIGAPGALTVTNGHQLTTSGNLQVAGSLVVGPPSAFRMDSILTTSGMLHMLRGSIDVDQGKLFTNDPSSQSFVMERGTLSVRGGEVTVTGSLMQNGGTISLDDGIITTGGGYFQNGGRVEGSGFIDNNAFIDGTINPKSGTNGTGGGGFIAVDGNLVIGSNGLIRLSIGSEPGSLINDLIAIEGFLQFSSGTIVIETMPGYVPTPGDTFMLMTFNGLVGGPASIKGLNLGNGFHAIPTLTIEGFSLMVVPAPSALAPIAIAGLLFGSRRRR